MLTAHQLRTQIEAQLANRIPSALTPALRLIRETIPTGIRELDELVSGGFPLGSITEVIGAPSTGRTTIAMSLVANVSRSGNVCAWIDAASEFDVVSAADFGVVLPRLLLIRCGMKASSISHPEKYKAQQPTVFCGPLDSNMNAGHGSPHPRNEIRGLGDAVGELFQFSISGHRTKPGTPSAPNIKLSKVARSEQVASDRLPPRRGHTTLTKQSSIPSGRNALIERPPRTAHVSSYRQIEEAIKVTDLLMQNGGFRAVILNFSSFAPNLVNRIPLATWFRFRSLAELHHACIVLLTQHPCAKSSAALSLQLAPAEVMHEGPVMTGLVYRASVIRQRFAAADNNILPLRKPPQRASHASWESQAAWAIP